MSDKETVCIVDDDADVRDSLEMLLRRSDYTVRSFGSALLAALVIGLINATVGIALKILTFPLTLLTFGLFLLVINALMIMLASSMLDGFRVSGFWPAFFGAIVLAIVSSAMRALISD